MSTLDRYKKSGGFIQLLNLIETSDGPKQERFLKLISEENSNWEAEVRKKMLTIDRMCQWPPQFLGEVLPNVPPAQLAGALKGMTPDKQALFLGALNFGEKRKVEDALNEVKPTPAEIKTCQTKVILEARNQIATGHLKIDKCDPEMVIPEGIEEQLSSGKPVSLNSSNNEPSRYSEPAVSSPTMNTASSSTGSGSEELAQLRKKLVQLTQENQKLMSDMKVYKDKLDQIKKIA